MIIEFTRGKQRYQIKPQGTILVGYVDGVPTVIARTKEAVALMLIRKRMGDRETAEIIQLRREPVA